MSESLIGKVGVCSAGKVGVISDRKKLEWGESWVGVRWSDGSLWASRNPKIVANSPADYASTQSPATDTAGRETTDGRRDQ